MKMHAFLSRMPKLLLRILKYPPRVLTALLIAIGIHSFTVTFAIAAPPDNISATCAEGPFPILVHVEDLRNNHGTIKAKLYGDNPDEFLVTGKKLNARRVPVNGHSTSLCLYAPVPGMYAIVVHHDENGNRKLDQNFIGIPTEGVGFSNNPKLFLAPPSHDEVEFPVTNGGSHINIRMQY